MESNELKAVVEALLFASGDTGVTTKQLAQILKIPDSNAELLLEELKFDYEQSNRGMMIIQSKQVYHLTTRPEHSSYLKMLLAMPQSTRMSQAALETLAIIAYKQPITRTEIDEIRGVQSDRPVQTLIARSLIEEMGRRDTVGKPILFGTSKEFLTYFGLTSLEELPPLSENVDMEELEQETDLFFNQLHPPDKEQ
ncbi:SMC-Scp complex subunit ScpB [Virgibacillus alimentarius]|uniref:Segregation and condensation protein B n=1 Tax=Virgibacillus alimentarius TaxID=698769 RepID=A0ABS4S4J8_9BACI|nr:MULTISPECIES: SMC-Scp complex subunit ScpB [Virgibacillus]MBP2256416.1 segregation and condensation protein B [Virgibacillus alimentarius]HLR66361.1 SMC-Scp complex subunit ScpB [Virgibacillus sp.]